MNAVLQLDMFRETTPEDMLRAQFEALKESHHSVRKRAFAELRGLQKMIIEQQAEIDYLKVKMGLACAVNAKS